MSHKDMIRALTIRADDVGAYLWALSSDYMRKIWCTNARLSDVITILSWYELGSDERIPLMLTMLGQIEYSASQQRQARQSNKKNQEEPS